MRVAVGIVLITALMWGGLSCSGGDPVAGGSEAGNARVAGLIQDSTGAPIGGALVQLREADYLYGEEIPAGRGGDTRTERDGEYVFAKVLPGEYKLAVFTEESRGAFVDCIVPEGAEEVEQTPVQPESLSVLEGVVDGPGVSGLEIIARPYALDRKASYKIESGRFRLEGVPPGVHSINVSPLRKRYHSEDIENIVVRPNTSTRIAPVRLAPKTESGFDDWKDRQRLVLNTGPSGVRISEPVYGFPLLVRLTPDNFAFSAADANGADIRFASSEGSALPYEIESWNAESGNAIVWVRIDTIRPDDEGQHILMLWGNESAVSLSDGASVFDTGDGYSGVWHLGEAPGREYCLDATAFRNDAQRLSSWDTVVAADGVIAGGYRFGRSYFSYLSVPDAPCFRVQSFTFSTWLFREPHNSATYPSFVSKQNWDERKGYIFGYVRKDDSLSLVSRFLSGKDAKSTNVEYNEPAHEKWIHVCAAYNGEKMQMYSNGELVVDSVVGKIGISHDTTSLQIGRAFKGFMDEVRVSRKARSSEWIRLLYETQRPDQRFLLFQ